MKELFLTLFRPIVKPEFTRIKTARQLTILPGPYSKYMIAHFPFLFPENSGVHYGEQTTIPALFSQWWPSIPYGNSNVFSRKKSRALQPCLNLSHCILKLFHSLPPVTGDTEKAEAQQQHRGGFGNLRGSYLPECEYQVVEIMVGACE